LSIIRFWLHIFIGTFLLGCSGIKTPNDDLNGLIEQTRNKYAPDKRVAIFNVEIKNGMLKGETNLPEAKNELINALEPGKWVDSIIVLKPKYGIVNVSVCNIRSEPRHSGELATQSLMGTILRIYKQQENWSLVQTPDGYLGWLDRGALIQTDPDRLSRWRLAKKVVIIKSFDFVFADRNKTIISDVVEGNILEAGDQFEEFMLVKLPDGRSGFINYSSITPYEDFINPREPLLENILITANHMMGRPYLWGGTSGKGMDCSGFTKTVYYLNGLELPRDASQQVNVGVEVETDTSLRNLIPGDFIFFGQKKEMDQKEKITHVAMYLGEGKIIHASDRIQIESLKTGDPDFTERRLNTMVRAKRMLENIGEKGVKKLADHPLYH
jgi:hypothetical protein